MVDSTGNLLPQRVHIFVNGRNMLFMNGIETVIPEEANISIFPPVGGG
jgi:molybdopterin synthase sulfur carrier subunit